MLLDSTPPGGPEARQTILVVEDERVVAKDLRSTLEKLGYSVPETVASGEEAIRAASAHCPDVVLMDIRIKGLPDGVDTAEILRRRFDVPVIFLTAHADDETVARAKRVGPSGYLLKPIDRDELRRAVEIGLYRHQMERQLREREHWFSATLRSIGDAVVSTDPAGLITFMNPAAETLTGWRNESARGRPMGEVLRLVDAETREPLPASIAEAVSCGTVIQREATLLPREKEPLTVNESAAPVIDDEGRVLGAVLVFSDVTESRQLRQRLELADRLASLGTLAAGVAHEINNPLTAVLTNLKLALGDLTAGQRSVQVAPLLSDAAAAAERIAGIVADLRVFSQPNAAGVHRTDVLRVLQTSLGMAESQLRSCCRVITDLRPVLEVMANETRLGQVFLNLLVNAAQAMSPDRAAVNEVHVSTATDAEGQVVIDIRDTGMGMSEDVLKRVFEPFFTTKAPGRGTGLGLSISHGIVRSFGGDIEVESRLGQGSRFRVLLPPAPRDAPVRAPGPAAAAVAVPGPRRKILIVDDEDLVRRAVGRMLGGDYAVTAVETGAAAMALLAAGDRFDLILCDLMMDDMHGVDFHDTLLQRFPEQARRVVLMTGGAYTTRSTEFLRAMAGRCLSKPFDPEELNRTVSKLLAGWGPIGPS
jgi:PAS domain S-box-containing protein